MSITKKRLSEETAERMVKDLKKTKDIKSFIWDFSDEASWYGRFGRTGRLNLTSAVINEIEKSKIFLLVDDDYEKKK